MLAQPSPAGIFEEATLLRRPVSDGICRLDRKYTSTQTDAKDIPVQHLCNAEETKRILTERKRKRTEEAKPSTLLPIIRRRYHRLVHTNLPPLTQPQQIAQRRAHAPNPTTLDPSFWGPRRTPRIQVPQIVRRRAMPRINVRCVSFTRCPLPEPRFPWHAW
jgi:hypothetical protein